ncbi:MAG TPA: LLM class flavin-dependent oxidoreductase [Acidimicrobiales bacterium]|nr:LLM class flavin-dependent oxidoreductase [Acidimicrobiales bacterium]
MERTPTALGPIGLFLPTFVQDATPPWAPELGRLPAADAAAYDAESSPGHLPPPADPVAHLAAVCRGAEQLGADALWACDHLFWHGPSLECMVALAVAATATDRPMLGTSVLQLPLRQAPAVAKQSATLQILTRGRVILGVGVGSHQGEYEQAGIDYRSRGRQLDAGIAELRRSWATGEGATPGDAGSAAEQRYRQLPEPPRVPVWVGGSSEAALRRAARMADGWMPLYLKPPEYGDALDRLAKEVERAGRDAGAVTASIVLFVSIDDDADAGRRRGTRWMSTFYGIPSKAFDRHLVFGTPSEVADVVSAYRRAGAEHVGVYVTDDQPLEQFERLVSALPATGAS